MTPRFHTSRAPQDVRGIRSSGLSWSYVNGPLEKSPHGHRTLVKLCCLSAVVVLAALAALIAGYIFPEI